MVLYSFCNSILIDIYSGFFNPALELLHVQDDVPFSMSKLNMKNNNLGLGLKGKTNCAVSKLGR